MCVKFWGEGCMQLSHVGDHLDFGAPVCNFEVQLQNFEDIITLCFQLSGSYINQEKSTWKDDWLVEYQGQIFEDGFAILQFMQRFGMHLAARTVILKDF